MLSQYLIKVQYAGQKKEVGAASVWCDLPFEPLCLQLSVQYCSFSCGKYPVSPSETLTMSKLNFFSAAFFFLSLLQN